MIHNTILLKIHNTVVLYDTAIQQCSNTTIQPLSDRVPAAAYRTPTIGSFRTLQFRNATTSHNVASGHTSIQRELFDNDLGTLHSYQSLDLPFLVKINYLFNECINVCQRSWVILARG